MTVNSINSWVAYCIVSERKKKCKEAVEFSISLEEFLDGILLSNSLDMDRKAVKDQISSARQRAKFYIKLFED
jgi:hypothetical protein